MPDKLTGADIEELDSLTYMMKGTGWQSLKSIFNQHRIHCIEQTNKHLQKHEDRKAGEWLARSKEPNHLLSLINDRKEELSQKKEGAK